MQFSKKIAVAVRKTTACQKVAVIVYGLKVRHAHLHLVPAHGAADELNFARAQKAPEPELEAMCAKIKKNLSPA